MINVNFTINNPWSNCWNSIKVWHGTTPLPYKFWEIQIMKTADIICIDFSLTHMRDHAGLEIELGLFGWNTNFKLYDSRHWNNVENRWMK
jgi:hypothetical protein